VLGDRGGPASRCLYCQCSLVCGAGEPRRGTRQPGGLPVVVVVGGVVQDGGGQRDDALVLADRVVEADRLPGVPAPLLPDASAVGADHGVDVEGAAVVGLHGFLPLCVCTLSIGDRGRGCNLGQRASLGHVHDPAGADDVPVGVAQHALVLPGQDAVSGHAQDLLHGGALQPAVVVGEGVVAGGELDGDVLLAVGVV